MINTITNQSPADDVIRQCNQWRDNGQLHYCRAEVRWIRNDLTGQVDFKGYLGVAPDEHTIILYPIHVWNSEYGVGKTRAKKLMSSTKRDLLARMKELGWTRKHLTRPVEMKSMDYF